MAKIEPSYESLKKERVDCFVARKRNPATRILIVINNVMVIYRAWKV